MAHSSGAFAGPAKAAALERAEMGGVKLES